MLELHPSSTISPKKYFYIVLTVHGFNEIINDWIGDIHDCNTIHPSPFHQECVSFFENVTLRPSPKSDEELEKQLQDQEN